jgi:hypothetical protein
MKSGHPLKARGIAALLVCLPAMSLTACGNADSEGQGSEQQVAAEFTTTANTGSSMSLPETFPAAIPLPDDYIVVRNDSRQGGSHGTEIGLNIAMPGTIEEWLTTYGAALDQHFEDVELTEDPSSRSWRFSFHGQGFEVGNLYLNQNRGYLDRGDIDSSHLPVMLTVGLSEMR